MKIEFADIVQIIVAIIGLMGVIISSMQGKKKTDGPAIDSTGGKRGEKITSPKKWRGSKIALWVSIVLLTTNLAIFGWRFWGPTPSDCQFDNLLSCSVFVPIFIEPESRLTANTEAGNLVIDFSNGQEYSGVAFQFTPALDVREFTHLDISGTATQNFKFVIEYKVSEGDLVKVVESSAYKSFPAMQASTIIQMPLKYDGKVDEIALMFHEKGEASQVTIESIRLK